MEAPRLQRVGCKEDLHDDTFKKGATSRDAAVVGTNKIGARFSPADPDNPPRSEAQTSQRAKPNRDRGPPRTSTEGHIYAHHFRSRPPPARPHCTAAHRWPHPVAAHRRRPAAARLAKEHNPHHAGRCHHRLGPAPHRIRHRSPWIRRPHRRSWPRRPPSRRRCARREERLKMDCVPAEKSAGRGPAAAVCHTGFARRRRGEGHAEGLNGGALDYCLPSHPGSDAGHVPVPQSSICLPHGVRVSKLFSLLMYI